MNSKLAIIGASYLQLPLVLKAKALGIETHCFAWKEGAVCQKTADFYYPISVLEKQAILEKCNGIGINGVTSIASDAVVPTVCYVAEKMGLVSNTYQSSKACTNKYLMRQKMENHDVNSPRFDFVGIDRQPSLSKYKFPLIVKPVDRSGSRGVSLVERNKDLQLAIQNAVKESFSGQAIIEEYVAGKEVSVESISWEGRHSILAITDKVTTGAPHFVELEHHQPSALNDTIQKKIREETLKSLDALEIRYGAGHSEFKITPEGEVYLIEVGARMGGDFIGSDLVFLSTGYDFLKGVIKIALGDYSKPVCPIEKNSGIYFLCENTRRLMPIISDKSHKFVVSSEITNHTLKAVKQSADRSGYLIYQSNKKIIL